jgi:hypothetical protein
MATELIRTEDPNIVIERTITENVIDLERITIELEGMRLLYDDLLKRRHLLEDVESLPDYIKEIVLKERDILDADISLCQNKIAELKELLIF